MNPTIAPQIENLYRDKESLGPVHDEDNWYVTERWAAKFRKHQAEIEELAKLGDPIAQKEIAGLYFGGYLHSSEEEALKHYEGNLQVATFWWLKAIHGGEYPCIHLIAAVGVGEEAERIREVIEENRSILSEAAPPSGEWMEKMKQIYVIAYPSS